MTKPFVVRAPNSAASSFRVRALDQRQVGGFARVVAQRGLPRHGPLLQQLRGGQILGLGEQRLQAIDLGLLLGAERGGHRGAGCGGLSAGRAGRRAATAACGEQQRGEGDRAQRTKKRVEQAAGGAHALILQQALRHPQIQALSRPCGRSASVFRD
jgi:hypothetical protein